MDNNEIEALPLVKIRGAGLSAKDKRRRRLFVCIGASVVIGVIFGALVSNARTANDSGADAVTNKLVNSTRTSVTKPAKSQTDCPKVCSALKQSRVDAFGDDLLESQNILKAAIAAKQKALSILKKQYGENYFSAIFEEKKDGNVKLRKAIVSANVTNQLSTKRFRRKLMIKLLSVQTKLLDDSKSIQGCDCNSGNRKQKPRRVEVENDALKSNFSMQFIWATGGHSSAAGHGNLYNESYTAVMERTVKPVFASVGIDFIGKNYAMGGTSSAPEVALCAEAIFGSDPDAVSWDFGMTDGTQSQRMLLYNYRAAMLPSRPALFGIDFGTRRKFRRDNYIYFEDDGLPSFALEPSEEQKMNEALPDTDGMNEEQIRALPPFVRNFKCTGKIESGSPYCDTEKYSMFICPDRKYRAHWHPGWKAHALRGNAIALFLIDALVDAANELASKSLDDPHQLLKELKNQEDEEYSRFSTSVLPLSVLTQLQSTKIFDEVSPSVFYKGPTLCHTGHLPAETRYLGYLTETNERGFWDYDKGVSKLEVDSNPPVEKDKSPMRLVFEADKRQDCSVTLNVDYKDYFYTITADGWTTLTIPNDSEAKAYRYDSSKIWGLVMVCFTGCDWGRCEAGTIKAKEINEGKAELELNGLPVKSLDDFDLCSLLRGEDGLKWKPNAKGRFDFRARVSEPNSFIRISSVVIL